MTSAATTTEWYDLNNLGMAVESGMYNITNGLPPQVEELSTKTKGLIAVTDFFIFSKITSAMWIFISCFGFCTNVLNIRTFVRMSPDDSVTILFLALSIADFLICNLSLCEAIATVVDIVALDMGVVLSLPPNAAILYIFTVRRILSVVTVLITSFLAVQRCLCVILPLRIKGMFTKRLTFICLVAALIFALVPYSIYIWQYRVVRYIDPMTGRTMYRLGFKGLRTTIIEFLSVGMGIVLNLTAQVLIITCLVVMGYGLKKSTQFRKAATTTKTDGADSGGGGDVTKDKRGNKERQALLQVTIVSTIFVITNTPFLLVTLVTSIEPRIDLWGAYKYMYIALFRIMFIVEIVNSSVNFFVYFKYNSRFKKVCFRSEIVEKSSSN